MTCKHFIITGRVQGVYFRATTCEQARRLGMSGWVRNLVDGSVEVLACGESVQMQELEEWLWHGPERAQVLQVLATNTDMSPTEFHNFEIR